MAAPIVLMLEVSKGENHTMTLLAICAALYIVPVLAAEALHEYKVAHAHR